MASYANTLLATLNNRAIILRIQDQRSEGDCCEISDGEGAPELGYPSAGSVESLPMTFALRDENNGKNEAGAAGSDAS